MMTEVYRMRVTRKRHKAQIGKLLWGVWGENFFLLSGLFNRIIYLLTWNGLLSFKKICT